ncbi:hypothetical protein JG687_00011286 [Phytophthora cactorum]|uniref:Uncharacterized protein n=1 Tax=Phytophthora cactorum TaxID=29920 RepID=A0A8T1U7K8_9STRA|nr:hypothetical protein JG687_00011286 [Phytophthora cactorum]
MGCNQGYERQLFTDTGQPKRGGRPQAVCRHCLAAYNDDNRAEKPPAPKVNVGRDTNYTSHLKSRQYYQKVQERGDVTPPPVQPTILHHFLQQTLRSVSRSSIEDSASTSSAKPSQCICQYFNPVFSKDDHEEFGRLRIEFQADNCLPDRFIEKLSTRRLLIFLNRACAGALPKRKAMGLILDNYSKVEAESQVLALNNRLVFRGGRLNFLSDYYRRYVGTDKESDIESLSADLHAWYRGVFVNGSIVRFNGDIGQYWRFAGDIREDSKLPKLAAIILSIAVNTATCKDISVNWLRFIQL